MGTEETTREHRRPKPGIDWRGLAVWVGGLAAPTALGVAGWAHGVLWGHDTRLTTLEVQRQAAAQEFNSHQERDVRAQVEIREALRRLEDKLDRLNERNLR